MTLPTFEFEQQYEGQIMAGVDEAGRGPLAGPVVAAAVIVDSSRIVAGVKDSKNLPKASREALYDQITDHYLWSVGIVDNQTIDRINILEATKLACIKAVDALSASPAIVLVDGNMRFNDARYLSIIKGDARSYTIAAASIVAKVTRDCLMSDLHQALPHYRWDKNAGYGTSEHLASIQTYGLSSYHRRTFKIRIPNAP